MADNIAITEGSGRTIATDQIGGVDFQRIKLISGADGVNDGDVDDASPLPIYAGHKTARPGNLSLATITNLASSGNNALVAADSTKVIRVYAIFLKASGAVDGKVRNTVASADYFPIVKFTAAGDGMILDYLGFPYFISAASADLQVNLSAAVAVNGWILYSQE